MYKIRPGHVVEASIIGGGADARRRRSLGGFVAELAHSGSCFNLTDTTRHVGDGDLWLRRVGAAGVDAALPARLSLELPEDRHDRAAGRSA